MDAIPSKQCTKCNVTKPITKFYRRAKGEFGVRSDCKPCHLTQKKVRYIANKDNKIEYGRAYYAANREKKSEYNRAYHDAKKTKRNERARQRRATDPSFALRCTLSGRLNSALVSATKSASTPALVGIDLSDLVKRFEFQFLDDRMTWETKGKYWQVDHVIPFAKVDTVKPASQELICNAINLRPLSKEENYKKSDKFDPWLTICQEVKFRHFNKHVLNGKYKIVAEPIEVKV